MTTKDNIPVPNPPKAVQRGFGLLNPPRRSAGRNSITPPPPEPDDTDAPFDDTEFDESATQRIQVGFLRQPARANEISKTEPLLLQNIRLASGMGTRQSNTQGTASSDLLKPRRHKRPLSYDLDEDAITKKIVVNRIVTVTPGNNNVHTPNTHIRVETTEQVTHPSGVPITTGEYRNPLASERPTDLSALGRATKAAEQRLSVLPSIRSGIRKVLSILSPHQKGENLEVTTPMIEPSDTHYNLGVNSYSTELYKEMRHALQAGADPRKNNLPVPRYTYLVSRPPRIVLKGFLVRREKKTSLMLRGRAIHPLCVRDVMIFADKKKVLYLSSAARNDAGCIEFSADIPLNGDTSHILVVARHNDEVMGSQSLFVRKDDY